MAGNVANSVTYPLFPFGINGPSVTYSVDLHPEFSAAAAVSGAGNSVMDAAGGEVAAWETGVAGFSDLLSDGFLFRSAALRWASSCATLAAASISAFTWASVLPSCWWLST